MEKLLSPTSLISFREKIEILCFISDEEIDENRNQLREMLNKWSSKRRDDISSWASWILRGTPRISRDVGAINRVLKEYSNSSTDEIEKGLVNSINAVLLLFFYRLSYFGEQSEIAEEIFTFYLAKRLNEMFMDENDYLELLKCQIMQDLVVPIKSICEKTARLIEYSKGIKNSLNEDRGYGHLNNIYTILDYLLEKKTVIGDRFLAFNRNFFILMLLISELRNISIHGSSHRAECAQLTEECEQVETVAGEEVIHSLIIELEMKDTIEKRLSDIKKDIEKGITRGTRNIERKRDFPQLTKEIKHLLNAYDSTFLKKVSSKEEDLGGGFIEINTQVISRIDEMSKIIQVEVSKLLEALHSSLWHIFFDFSLHLDNQMFG